MAIHQGGSTRTDMSIDEIRAKIKSDVSMAMYYAENRTKYYVKKEFEGFYKGEKPKLYKRTNKLKYSWRSTSGSVAGGLGWGGNKLAYSFWIEEPYYGENANREKFRERGYGSSLEGMAVIAAANKGGEHIVGNSGFWDRSLIQIEKQFYRALDECFN